jgi:hypothetical protein
MKRVQRCLLGKEDRICHDTGTNKVLQELERRLLLAKGKKRIIGKVLFKMGILEREGEKRERERERDLSEK